MTAPIEMVGFQLRCQDELLRNGRIETRYRGPIDCTTRIIHNYGIFVFWRGYAAGYYTELLAPFAHPTALQRFLDTYRRSYLGSALAATISGAFALLFTTPVDVARAEIWADLACQQKFGGIIDAIKKIHYARGFGGLYQGYLLSVLATLVECLSFFGLHRLFRSAGRPRNSASNYARGFAISLLPGIISYSIHTVRLHMIVSPAQYSSAWQCASSLVSAGGITALFAGLGVHVFCKVLDQLLREALARAEKEYLRRRFPDPPPLPPVYTYEEQLTQ